MDTWYFELVYTLLCSMSQPARKRSVSWNGLNAAHSSDEEPFWSTSSSRKASEQIEPEQAAKMSTVGMLPNYRNEKNISRFRRSNRSQSNPMPVCVGRRGSISLPEILDGLPTGRLSNRLSLVADELEDSFREMRRTNSNSTHRFSLLNLLSSHRSSIRDE